MTIKNSYAGIALVASIVLMFTGMYVAPVGIIDPSILYGTAQLLLFAATMLGFGQTVAKVTELVNDFKNSIHSNPNGSKGNKEQ